MNQRIKDALRQSGRAEVDVTATMAGLFGAIPAQCRGGDPLPPGSTPEPEPAVLPAPTNLRLLRVTQP